VYSDSATSVRWTGASIPAWRDGRIFAEQPGRPNRVSLVNYLPARGALRLGDAFTAFGRPLAACEEGGGLWRDILFEGGVSVVLGPMHGDKPERLYPEMIVR
jgi:hypothetical protein